MNFSCAVQSMAAIKKVFIRRSDLIFSEKEHEYQDKVIKIFNDDGYLIMGASRFCPKYKYSVVSGGEITLKLQCRPNHHSP